MARRTTVKPTQSKVAVAKKVKALEKISKITLGKSDSDRLKRVKKEHKGDIRICPGCKAVSERKRWAIRPDLYAQYERDKSAEKMLCPGCERVKNRRVDGWVELNGKVLSANAKEIRNMIGNIESYAKMDDPVHRVVSITEGKTKWDIETTSEWLAETIGKAIQRQYRGDLKLHFNHDEEFVRVYWYQKP